METQPNGILGLVWPTRHLNWLQDTSDPLLLHTRRVFYMRGMKRQALGTGACAGFVLSASVGETVPRAPLSGLGPLGLSSI